MMSKANGSSVNSHELIIDQGTLQQIDKAVRRASPKECGGFLGSSQDGLVINQACLLRSAATKCSALFSPLAISQAVHYFNQENRSLHGLWHGHGRHAVFHSSTDDETLQRLAPLLAEKLFGAPTSDDWTPSISQQDLCRLRVGHREHIEIRLRGRKLDEGYERVAWTQVHLTFMHERQVPHFRREMNCLRVYGGHVCACLGIPAGATLEEKSIEPAASLAHVYSLVVNERAEHFVKVFSVSRFDNQVHVSGEECSLRIVSAPRELSPINSDDWQCVDLMPVKSSTRPIRDRGGIR